jgi:hypothetical protein
MLIKKPIAKLSAKETRLGLEPKKKTVKKVIKKSNAARKVLQAMDKGHSYQAALTRVLMSDKRLSRAKLTKELNHYI